MGFRLVCNFNVFVFKVFSKCRTKKWHLWSFYNIFLMFLVLFWLLLFDLLMSHEYSVAMLVSVFLFYWWSVKCQLKNAFCSRVTFQFIFCMLMKENLWKLPLWFALLYLSLVLFLHLLLIMMLLMYIFVDDRHARFSSTEQSLQLWDTLNSQGPFIQCTIEFENENKIPWCNYHKHW